MWRRMRTLPSLLTAAVALHLLVPTPTAAGLGAHLKHMQGSKGPLHA